MPKCRTAEDVYQDALAQGEIHERTEVNKQFITDLLENAGIMRDSADKLKRHISKNDAAWLSVYVQYYEALRICAEAYAAIFQKKISNHRCLFAYLCVKHTELDFDWGFFEKVRTSRNGAHYHGSKIKYDDWKSVSVQFTLYISALRKEIRTLILKSGY